MRYCYNCHRITPGEPLFCNYCGRSYDMKLCPSRHPNSRTALVCSECGSTDLSTPQPRAPWWLSPLLSFVTVIPGILLVLVSIGLLVSLLRALLQDRQVMSQFMVLTLLLGLFWWIYMQLPGFVRRAFGRGMRALGPGKRNERKQRR